MVEQKVFGIATIGQQLLYFQPYTSQTIDIDKQKEIASLISKQYNTTFQATNEAPPNYPNCPGNHTLKEFGVYNDSFTCDGCRNRALLKDTMFGCRICNYDLCEWCYNKNRAIGTKNDYKIAIESLQCTIYCNTKENNLTIGFIVSPSVGYKYTFNKSIIQSISSEIHQDLDSMIQKQTNIMNNNKIPLYILQIQCHNIFRKRTKTLIKAISKSKRKYYYNQCCIRSKKCCVNCFLPNLLLLLKAILFILFILSLCWIPYYLCYKCCACGDDEYYDRAAEIGSINYAYNNDRYQVTNLSYTHQISSNALELGTLTTTAQRVNYNIVVPQIQEDIKYDDDQKHIAIQKQKEIIVDKTSVIEMKEKEIEVEIPVADKMKNLMTDVKDKFAAWRAARKLVDNVFTDLENLFYLLSELIYECEFKKFSDDIKGYMVILYDFILIFVNLIIYPLIGLMSICVVLPSCFFLLIVRINKVETDTVKLEERAQQLKQETNLQRFYRLLNQFIRALFMFGFLVIYPIIIIYGIIPSFGNNDNIVIIFIGSYLFIIIALQIFGTYRGLKSFEKRKSLKPLNKQYIKQKWKWNIGSLIALILIIYQVFQLSIYAFHVIGEQNENKNDTNSSTKWTANGIIDSRKITTFANNIISICYLSINFVDEYILEFYALFSIIFVGILLLFFIIRFIYELKTYSKLKYKEKNEISAREFYFYSFLGTIIYGHGNLKGVSKWSSKLISLLSDTLFLPICQKVILILSCTSPIDSIDGKTSYLRIDPSNNTICWDNKHKLYATIALILLGYYIPISTMIAPIFAQEELEESQQDEEEEEDEKPKSMCKEFFSFDNTIQIVAPFMSTLTVTECFMLVTSVFISKGNAMGTIISQSICMICLSIFTLNWSINNLYLYGLTQNEPLFPYGISMIRILGFFCGLIGCIIEIFRYNNLIDDALDLFLLFISIIIISVIILIIFCKYYKIFNKFNHDIIDSNLMVVYDKIQKILSVNLEKQL